MSTEPSNGSHEEMDKTNVKDTAGGPTGSDPTSLPRVVVGVAAASGLTLLAVSVVGLAPALIAGAAGYATYRGMTGKKAA